MENLVGWDIVEANILPRIEDEGRAIVTAGPSSEMVIDRDALELVNENFAFNENEVLDTEVFHYFKDSDVTRPSSIGGIRRILEENGRELEEGGRYYLNDMIELGAGSCTETAYISQMLIEDNLPEKSSAVVKGGLLEDGLYTDHSFIVWYNELEESFELYDPSMLFESTEDIEEVLYSTDGKYDPVLVGLNGDDEDGYAELSHDVENLLGLKYCMF